MNADWNEFEKLVDLARREPVPAVDVVDRVAQSIQPQVIRPKTVTIDWPLIAASALSLTAALLVVGLATHQGVLTADPLTELFQPMIPVIQ
jgi:hypothetical protein